MKQSGEPDPFPTLLSNNDGDPPARDSIEAGGDGVSRESMGAFDGAGNSGYELHMGQQDAGGTGTGGAMASHAECGAESTEASPGLSTELRGSTAEGQRMVAGRGGRGAGR